MPTIDLRGPEGNAFYLLGAVRGWGRQLGVDTTAVLADMQSGDYEHLLQAMRDWCEEHHIDLELTGTDYDGVDDDDD